MKKFIYSVSRWLIVTVSLLAIFSLTNSCSKSSSGTPGPDEVFIQGMAFSPSTITITVGSAVTWTNKDGVAHTVTSTTGLFDSGSVNPGGTFSHTFATAGTYPYKCTIHPSMTGSVVVN